MAVRVTLECGHTSVLRSRTTKEGYTHDWEVFLRGVDNSDVHQYIEKVVFILHDTFPKPKRVIKEPPYVVRESGYAGFVIPINVYWKKKDEPKKFQILYDLHLQQSGPAINKVIRYDELFPNPPDEFRRKLLKGGAAIVSSLEGTQDKGEPQATLAMIGKPKLSGSDVKKHRPPEPRTSNSFRDLFGEPINKAKVSPDNKKVSTMDKVPSIKPTVAPDKVDKPEKISKVKHSPHKDGKREKVGEGDKKAEKRDKEHFRERERSKEKSKRPQSPAVKASHSSPGVKRAASPLPPQKKPPSPLLPPPAKKPYSPKTEKEPKKPSHEKEKEREKEKDKPKLASDPTSKGEKRKEKKKHKEERDKDKKDKHKERDRDKSKENTKYNDKLDKPELVKQEKIDRVEKQVDKQIEKVEKGDNHRSHEARASSKESRKSPRPKEPEPKSKPEEKPVKIEKQDKVEKSEKNKEGKGDREKQKHKHKKRDKKDRGDGSKEREKKEKKERSKSGIEKQNNSSVPPPPTNPLSTLLAEMPERDSSDSAPSPDDDMTIEPKQDIALKDSAQSPPPHVEPPRPTSPLPSVAKKEKSEKVKKDKSKGSKGEERESRKRKRRNSSKGDDESVEKVVKREKERARSPSLPLEPVSSSQSPVATDSESPQQSKSKDEECENIIMKDGDGEAEQVAPDSTNNTLAEVEVVDRPVFSEDYVSQLKDLQQKIMTLQDNQELQRVVQVIAATGQYEITKKTFDFDLCTLDRRTVQRLQEFFSTS